MIRYYRRKTDGKLWCDWSKLPERILIEDLEDPIEPIPKENLKRCMYCLRQLNHTNLVHETSLRKYPTRKPRVVK